MPLTIGDMLRNCGTTTETSFFERFHANYHKKQGKYTHTFSLKVTTCFYGYKDQENVILLSAIVIIARRRLGSHVKIITRQNHWRL